MIKASSRACANRNLEIKQNTEQRIKKKPKKRERYRYIRTGPCHNTRKYRCPPSHGVSTAQESSVSGSSSTTSPLSHRASKSALKRASPWLRAASAFLVKANGPFSRRCFGLATAQNNLFRITHFFLEETAADPLLLDVFPAGLVLFGDCETYISISQK